MAGGEEIQLNDPPTLYRRWEDSQWSPFAIGLAADVAQWKSMSGAERELILFVLSSLMVAEERITTKFSGWSAPTARRRRRASSRPSRSTRRGTCSSTRASRMRS
jgi:hypothetical protein